MSKKHTDEQLADPTVPLPVWEGRPAAATGADALELGRMLLDDAVPGAEVITRARRGPSALGESGLQSPILRFRAAGEEKAALAELARTTHLNQSELLREGLQLVLAHYKNQADMPEPSPAEVVTVEVTLSELAALRALTERLLPAAS